MNSGINFRGIGEPIQQLRELLKDIWYRNNQEKELGRLELHKKRLELLRDIGDSNGTGAVLFARLKPSEVNQVIRLLLGEQEPDQQQPIEPEPEKDGAVCRHEVADRKKKKATKRAIKSSTQQGDQADADRPDD